MSLWLPLHLNPSVRVDFDGMMTSSNWNVFRVTGPLWGEFSGHRWIPLTKASDEELWCFHWHAPEQKVEQTIERLVIWGAIELMMTSPKCNERFTSFRLSRWHVPWHCLYIGKHVIYKVDIFLQQNEHFWLIYIHNVTVNCAIIFLASDSIEWRWAFYFPHTA